MAVNQLKAGVVLSYITQALQILITLFYTPIMLRLMGQSEFGIYQLALSTINLLYLMNLGFSGSYLKFYAKASQRDDAKKAVAELNGTYATVFGILSLFVFAAGLFLSFKSDSLLGGKLTIDELATAKTVMYLLTANCTLQFICVIPNVYITAKEHFVVGRFLTLLGVVLNPCLSLPLLYLGKGAAALSIALLAVTVIQLVAASVYCFRTLEIHFSFNNLHLQLFKDIAVFSFWIFLESIISMLNNNVDSIMLGKLVGASSIAVYRVGFSIVSLYMTLGYSITSVFTPRVNMMVEGGSSNLDINKLFIRVGRIQFLVLYLFVLGFAIFGQRFFLIWVGDGYEESYYIVMVLIVTRMIDSIQGIAYEIQRAKGLQKYRDYLWLGVAIGNVIISWFFIKQWGAFGAALGTAVAVVIGSGLLMNWYYATKVGLDVIKFWKEILRMAVGGILPLMAGIVFLRYIQSCSLLVYIILIVLFTLTYCISFYLFGLQKEDRNQVDLYLKKKYLKH